METEISSKVKKKLEPKISYIFGSVNCCFTSNLEFQMGSNNLNIYLAIRRFEPSYLHILLASLAKGVHSLLVNDTEIRTWVVKSASLSCPSFVRFWEVTCFGSTLTEKKEGIVLAVIYDMYYCYYTSLIFDYWSCTKRINTAQQLDCGAALRIMI